MNSKLLASFTGLLVLPLGACSSAMEDFAEYEISGIAGEDCTYDEERGEVVMPLRIRGYSEGEQEVRVRVTVENKAGDEGAQDTVGFKVKGKYDQRITVPLEMSKEKWDSGYTECYFGSGN